MLTEGDAVAIYEMKLAILADAASSLAANEPRSVEKVRREHEDNQVYMEPPNMDACNAASLAPRTRIKTFFVLDE